MSWCELLLLTIRTNPQLPPATSSIALCEAAALGLHDHAVCLHPAEHPPYTATNTQHSRTL